MSINLPTLSIICTLCGQPITNDGVAWTTGRPGGVGCPTTTGEITGHIPPPRLTLVVHTAVWTPEDIAHGANDPNKTTSETLVFSDVEEVIAYLRDNELTEASSWPVAGNETRVWFSETSRMLSPEEFEQDRYERTAHRGVNIDDDMWTTVVTAVAAG